MDSPKVSLIHRDDGPVENGEIELLGKIDLSKLVSVRTPGVHRDQKHLPGLFWMSQIDDFVWYESRFEMMILKTIDYERSVRAAISQPFLFSFRHNGKRRTHVPDFLFLLRDARPFLVNVKGARHLSNPRNALNFAACAELAEFLGWEYVTRTEPTVEYRANVNWLAGYRREPWLFAKYEAELLRRAADSPTIGQILQGMEPEAFVRPALFHLMWKRRIRFDSSLLLSDESKLDLGVGS
jgi:hypothetical protein